MKTLEDWLRRKVDENEKMHDYSVATETIRLWIDEFNSSKSFHPPTASQVRINAEELDAREFDEWYNKATRK